MTKTSVGAKKSTLFVDEDAFPPRESPHSHGPTFP